ncbi:MAG: terpene cyclase/mutase family protein [Planctomycetes bacterium]|jgi:squalene-hopene/tetraprenyl-beta-curcumene cyclase|nr:terpene cyclase/mutase family protein [Planctomycetota bacterium]
MPIRNTLHPVPFVLLFCGGLGQAQTPTAQTPAAPAQPAAATADWSPAAQKGLDFLLQHQKDGVFMVRMGERQHPDAGFTGLGLAAVQSKPAALRTEAEQKVVQAGMKWLLGNQNPDGSFGERVQNYTTCAVVMALSRWSGPGRDEALAKARDYVLALQRCEANGTAPSDVEYGGIGYGSKGERADLSNLQFAVSALRAAGLPANHEAFTRAVTFLQRTQNLSPQNDLPGKLTVKREDGTTAKLAIGNDGGAVYYPGESPAGYDERPDGALAPRSYGSMTYALLKCYTLCGLPGTDPRVQAAVQWIGANWTVVENPGADPKLGDKARYQGLYYYYLLLAQALDAAGIDRVAASRDGKVTPTDWRAALRTQLESLQRADGGWINDRNGRWYESLDVLCTCYALLALDACK